MLSKESIFRKVDAVDGWLNPPVVRLLYSICLKLPEEARIVEIGSWKGKSSVLLALSSPRKAKLYAIDPHIGSHEHKEIYGKVDTYQEFLSNLNEAEVIEKVECIRKFSRDAIAEVPSAIDFLWIDGSHDYKDVKDDFRLYFEKLKDDSYVAWHDYKWQGVKKFTWELLSDFDRGLVRRVEDTHYFKRVKPNKLFWLLNRMRLTYYQLFQSFKRRKRKIKKLFRERA